MLCMAGPEKKTTKTEREEVEDNEIDPATFLFEDDDEEEDLSDLPPNVMLTKIVLIQLMTTGNLPSC